MKYSAFTHVLRLRLPDLFQKTYRKTLNRKMKLTSLAHLVLDNIENTRALYWVDFTLHEVFPLKP